MSRAKRVQLSRPGGGNGGAGGGVRAAHYEQLGALGGGEAVGEVRRGTDLALRGRRRGGLLLTVAFLNLVRFLLHRPGRVVLLLPPGQARQKMGRAARHPAGAAAGDAADDRGIEGEIGVSCTA
jgi:hypothetical protein